MEAFAGKAPTCRTVQEQLDMGDAIARDRTVLVDSAQYVQHEMLVRLARTIRSFQNLPYIVGINPRIQAVYVKCWDWFVSLYEWTDSNGQVTSLEEEEVFTTHLLTVFQDHGNVMQYLRQGVAEIRELPSSETVDFAYVDQFLTHFIMRRTSWRVLAESHLAYRSPKGKLYNGVFNLEARPALIAQDAFTRAQYLCEAELCDAPQFAVKGDTETCFAYIDAHMQYILHELIKNSMRATVNFHRKQKRSGRNLPKVVLRICHGDEITISLHDRGGGIPTEMAKDVWGFGFTTVEEEKKKSKVNLTYFPGMHNDSFDIDAMLGSKQLAGWGFGLPLSRYVPYLWQIENVPITTKQMLHGVPRRNRSGAQHARVRLRLHPYHAQTQLGELSRKARLCVKKNKIGMTKG